MSKQPFPRGSGRITLKTSLRDYPHLLKSPNFRLLVLKCAGSYSRVFTVFEKKQSCTALERSVTATMSENGIGNSENKIITQSGLFKNEVGPGAPIQSSVNMRYARMPMAKMLGD